MAKLPGSPSWKVFEGTDMPERLPDLGLHIKGVELSPGRENHRRSEREHQRASESEREDRDVLSTSLETRVGNVYSLG